MTSIGIDLGTTHSAVAVADPGSGDGGLRVLEIPQVTAPGQVERRPLLGSFLYLTAPGEFASGALALPWSEGAERAGELVGDFARRRGAEAPMRVVSSAKSWLCHAGVNRSAAILPPHAPGTGGAADVRRVSPVDASAAYLAHLAAALDDGARRGDVPAGERNVVLTVPASFDPVARELTLEAARRAGFGNVTLLEEPQAALYSWIARMGDRWREHLQVGDVVLVVDVGGGTTDFSLIAIEEDAGSLAPRRLAVGDHILLGGDNMDLALGLTVRARLEEKGVTLDEWQTRALVLACRDAKERLLGGELGEVDSLPLVIPSRGSSLVGGSIRAEVTLLDAIRVLLDGFFPDAAITDEPLTRARTGVTDVSLPYAQDAAVTRHLGAFLRKHHRALGDAGPGFAAPTHVLFNGGVFKAPELRGRTLGTLGRWLREAGLPEARELPGGDLDLACARGAAFYAEAREGRGVRIRGGSAFAYYVGVEAAMPAVPGFAPPVHALCVAARGTEEGSEWVELEDAFGLVVGETASFRFFRSSVREGDQVGTRVTRWSPGEIEELAALEAKLERAEAAPGNVVTVRLRTRVSDLGALELAAREEGSETPWRLAFDLRGGHEGARVSA